MNIKLNLGEIDINLQEGDVTPSGSVKLKDISYEVTDLSLTEYGSVLKGLLTEASGILKDFSKIQSDMKEAEFERDIQLIQTRANLDNSIQHMERDIQSRGK